MNCNGWTLRRLGLVAALVGLGATAYGQALSGLDVDGIARAMGNKGEASGEMYKVSFLRSDLEVKVGDVLVKPALALNNWAAFKRAGGAAMTYGDLAVLDRELNPVLSKLEDGGIEVSAIHNHLVGESPRVLFIHFMGHGKEVELAKGLRDALALTKTPLEAKPAGPAETKPAIAEQIERIIGVNGGMSGGVFHIVVPRSDIHVKMMGTEVPGNMGMNTPLNFQIEGDKAAINGDFMLLAPEVNPAIKTLRAHGIEIASLHNHMLDAEPLVFFMHFWAYGDAVELAKGLKAALDAQKERENGGKVTGETLEHVKVTLGRGLAAGAKTGTPISAKFEMDDGKLQLSVYTAKAGEFSEVIVDQTTGKVTKTEAITGGDDLAAAKAQSEAMAKAKTPLRSAVRKALAANKGWAAIGAVAALKDGRPVAEVSIGREDDVKTVSIKLD